MRGLRTSLELRTWLVVALATLLVAAPIRPQSLPVPRSDPAATPKKPNAGKAKQTYEKGLKAEVAGDWRAAFAAYHAAAGYAPGDTEALLRREVARFRLVQQHTDRAEREALAGRLDLARGELEAALKLDPGYSVARERLAQFEAATPQKPPAPAEPPEPVELRPKTGTRDFNYRGDTRGAYEEVARQFGVVASFDSDLASRAIRFRVREVDFPTAMALLGQQTNTFWRAVDTRTFFVAENTAQKRREYMPVVMRTILLPAASTPDQMTEMARLVREIAGVVHTDLDTRSRTLTLRDTPENVALAATIIRELEQARGELMLEIEILEVDRESAQRLGITPPSAAQIFTLSSQDIREAQESTAGLLRVIQRIFGTAGVVPPVVAFGGGRTTFLATLPGAAADFGETLRLVRSGRRMLLRAQDGQPATFFIGERFPVSLAALTPSVINQVGVPLLNTGTFLRLDTPTGAGPAALASGDFNGDGRTDLATANQNADSISILPGNGDGTFGARTDLTGDTAPSAVVTGDFNRDARTDLAAANQGANNWSFFPGNGDGTFGVRTDLATGTFPVALVTADFNQDTSPDLVVANRDSDSVSIFLGNGDGTFGPATDLVTGTAPVALAVADFDTDGNSDLVVVNQTSNNVSFFPGNGNGTFGSRTDTAVGNGPSAVTIADFNADARVDFAVTNQTDNTVSVFPGNGDGTFGAPNTLTAGTAPVGVVAGDLDGDSRVDVAVVNRDSATVSVFLGNGDGTFGIRADFATGAEPSALLAGDFNADNRLDLAVTNRGADSLSIFMVPTGAAQAVTPLAPYPAFEYEDLGLKVRATPRMHAEGEVTLKLEFDIRSLAGVALNNIPVITNRTIEQTVRLRENEVTMLSGIVSREETRGITGWPGLARLPGLSRRDTRQRETELLIVLTPRKLRLALRADRSIYAGRGGASPAPERRQPGPPQ